MPSLVAFTLDAHLQRPKTTSYRQTVELVATLLLSGSNLMSHRCDNVTWKSTKTVDILISSPDVWMSGCLVCPWLLMTLHNDICVSAIITLATYNSQLGSRKHKYYSERFILCTTIFVHLISVILLQKKMVSNLFFKC